MAYAFTGAQDDILVPVSALQHYLFWPRQCALIHVERQSAEDGATAEGRTLHERVNKGARIAGTTCGWSAACRSVRSSTG